MALLLHRHVHGAILVLDLRHLASFKRKRGPILHHLLHLLHLHSSQFQAFVALFLYFSGRTSSFRGPSKAKAGSKGPAGSSPVSLPRHPTLSLGKLLDGHLNELVDVLDLRHLTKAKDYRFALYVCVCIYIYSFIADIIRFTDIMGRYRYVYIDICSTANSIRNRSQPLFLGSNRGASTLRCTGTGTGTARCRCTGTSTSSSRYSICGTSTVRSTVFGTWTTFSFCTGTSTSRSESWEPEAGDTALRRGF